MRVKFLSQKVKFPNPRESLINIAAARFETSKNFQISNHVTLPLNLSQIRPNKAGQILAPLRVHFKNFQIVQEQTEIYKKFLITRWAKQDRGQ